MWVDVAFNLPLRDPLTYRVEGEVPMGVRVRAPVRGRVLTGYVVERREEPPPGVSPEDVRVVERVLDEEPLFDERLLSLARWVSDYYLCGLGEALSAMIPGGRVQREAPVPYDEPAAYRRHDLSAAQRKAVEAVLSCGSSMFYLWGVTGSGKTEVYLTVAEHMLERGRGVLYLVPEIALTRQVVETIRARFGQDVAVLHSRLTASQRLAEWRRIVRGEVRFVIGARSAVFAPIGDLGLIVLDEEHESSYKSGATPRYHARQVAMHRARTEGALLLMGSATPSLEAYHLMHTGRLPFFHLPQRVAGGEPPRIGIVSLKDHPGPLSKPLLREIERTKKEGKQTILFLNRRGFAHYVGCRACGFEMTCRHCSLPLTYHRAEEVMVCHYCGYRTRPIEVCPSCGSVDVRYSGPGTEQVEKQLRDTFPFYRIARLDTDTARKKGVLERVLKEMESGQVDVLLGTQMIAKGFNFPRLGLVGVVLADTGLHMPDFRAAERVFSLLVQVAGRAGRFMPGGRVVIQTYLPDHPGIVCAREHDLRRFYDEELEVRKETLFPPFSRLIRLVFRGRDERKVERDAGGFASLLSADLPEGVELLGPAPCPMERIAGNYRYHLFLRSSSLAPMHGLLARTLPLFRPSSGVHLEVDVDPVQVV